MQLDCLIFVRNYPDFKMYLCGGVKTEETLVYLIERLINLKKAR